MIHDVVYLPEYEWTIDAYFAVTHYDIDDIMLSLWSIGCDAANAERAYDNLSSGKLDNGITYSNRLMRHSVLVVSMASDASQFVNSFAHEVDHLGRHISKMLGIDQDSEEVSYLCGDIAQMLFASCHELFCEGCRKELLPGKLNQRCNKNRNTCTP